MAPCSRRTSPSGDARRPSVRAFLVLAVVGLAAYGMPASAAQSTGDYNWYPGYYVLNHVDTAARKRVILDDPLVEPFTGVQFRYHWAASELSPGDYSAGFDTLDADLERVAAKGKKLMVMLMYKKSDGTSAVPADLRTGPGPWCSGSYCGEFTPDGEHALALLWNPVVEARLEAWIAAMAQHLSESPYIDSVAGIVFNETSLETTDTALLASADYDPDVYIQALEANMLAATTAGPRLIAILYFEGGFVSMDGESVRAGQKLGDWMLMNPRTGAGVSDLLPNDPKGTNHPCANPAYQSSIACAPAVQAGDYSTAVTDSFDRSFDYATAPAPDGLHASFLTFSYGVGDGPNAFTFADVSDNIASHPIPNTARPWPVTAPAPSPDLIFADGFRSGDLSAWTSSTTDGGDLRVSRAAALGGRKGLRARIDDNTPIYVTDDTPTAEPRYRARFYFDPNSIPMDSGDSHHILTGYAGTSTDVLRVRFRYRHGRYQLIAALRDDLSTWMETGWHTIPDAPRAVELDWRAATAAGANDGGLTLWIGGVERANLTGVDNDTWGIDRVRLGSIAGIDAGTRGTYYYDTFESRRQTYIGP